MQGMRDLEGETRRERLAAEGFKLCLMCERAIPLPDNYLHRRDYVGNLYGRRLTCSDRCRQRLKRANDKTKKADAERAERARCK